MSRLLEVARSFGALLFPRECAACPTPAVHGSVFCSACGEPIGYPPDELGGVPLLSIGRYAPPLSVAVARIKFENRADLIAPLARLLLPAVRSLSPAPADVLVPVPLHRSRLVERGFNQSALLALALARATGSGFAPRALERTRRTEQQAKLGRAARRDNVAEAFVLRRPWRAGRALVVDDVVTTGATALACVDALRAAGADVIAVVALARAVG